VDSAGRTQRNVAGDLGDLVAERRHSGLDIASLVLSLISLATSVIFVAVPLVAVSSDHERTATIPSDYSPTGVVVTVAGWATVCIALVALALGITGLAQKRGNRAFLVTGTTLAGVILVCFAALVAINISRA